MSTAARPRPRPKPRPTPRASSVIVSSPVASGSTPLPTVISIDDDDEDAMFNRRPAEWSRQPKVIKETRKASRVIDSESSDIEIAEPTPKRTELTPKRPQPKRKGGRKAVAPDWTTSSNLGFDFDDVNDDLIDARLADTATTTSGKRARQESEKRSSNKRQRSRSKSLTPPPELPQEIWQNAVDKIRDMVPVAPRAPSPTSFDDPSDEVDYDPELADIVNQVQAGKHSFTPAGSRGTTPALEGGPENVIIRLKWKPHPLNESGQTHEWDFKMKRHDPFKTLFEEAADEVAVLSDNIIVTHNGTRVFPSASPHGIGVFADAELEACDKRTYEYLRAHSRRSVSLAPDVPASTLGFSNYLPPTQEEDEDEASDHESAASVVEDKGATFKIILRSKIGKDISLTVRPTTTCGAIVKGFLKSAGLTDKYPGAGEIPGKAPAKKGRGKKAVAAPVAGGPWLMVDGDKMANNAAISEADLEDGDMIEVTGL
ncbi:hypothetical protein EUX98_g4054 [Antrodiella citrinella]|uniref:Rad60/SUMO-like domain-containing protein n=1 Tax=Antrodiella citrinella TaxID=2447956 RepID=A0A4S4MUX7_9APHY|nr:hypothetical protein EUX98_g4054 [Antrodiella citrinella]